MRLQVHSAVTKLVRNLAFMLWSDPIKRMSGRMEIPGADGLTLESHWTPEFRMGEFYDYDLNIDVFSMQYRPPEAKAQAIAQLLQTVYIPMAQQLQAQGGQIDLQVLLNLQAELLNLPGLKHVIRFTEPTQAASGGAEAGMPSTTTRNYVRSDSGGGKQPKPGFQMDKRYGEMAKMEQTNPDMAMSMVGKPL
jgi:hypothetical protein